MILLTCLLWLAAAGLTVWLLMRTAADPAPAGPPPGDPYADAVAEFRRQMHDWDRNA